MVMDKYKSPPQAPPTFTGTKESIVGDAKALCDTTRQLLDKLVAEIPADDKSKTTFETVMEPQAADENQNALSSRILGFYQYVSGDASLRDASTEAERIMDEFGIECGMREDVYKLVDATFNVYGGKDGIAKASGIDGEQARMLEKDVKGYIKNGLGLPAGPQRDRFKEIKKRLSELTIQFTKNLNEENGGVWFSPSELDGVPEDTISTLEKGTGENEGKLKVSFKYPELWPTLKYAKNAETRRKMFVANENKCGSNVDVRIYQTFAQISLFSRPAIC